MISGAGGRRFLTHTVAFRWWQVHVIEHSSVRIQFYLCSGLAHTMFTGWSDSKPVDAALRAAIETFPVMHSVGNMLQTEVASLSARSFKTQTVRVALPPADELKQWFWEALYRAIA
jgi:hypothetical protein